MKALFVLALLALAGCNDADTQAANDKITTYEGRLTAAVLLSEIYLDLPRCPAPGKPACSDQAVIEKMRPVKVAAVNGLLSAEKVGRDKNATANDINLAAASALAALDEFSAITSSLPVSK